MSSPDQAFWREKSLDQLTHEEWEALCDGCGQCCLLKLEDEETGELHHTRLACRLLDLGTCRCTDYPNRKREIADCIALEPDAVLSLSWMPGTCAYRLVAEGKDLHWWHPLVSGRAETVHEAGVSVRGWAKAETGIPESRLHRYVIGDPSRRRNRRG